MDGADNQALERRFASLKIHAIAFKQCVKNKNEKEQKQEIDLIKNELKYLEENCKNLESLSLYLLIYETCQSVQYFQNNLKQTTISYFCDILLNSANLLSIHFIKHPIPNPTFFLPILNDLRLIRLEAFYTQAALFFPDLAKFNLEPKDQLPLKLDSSHLLQLRKQYQQGVAGLINKMNFEVSLARLNHTIEYLSENTRQTVVEKFWKLTKIYFKLIIEKKINLSFAEILLLKQVGVYIAQLQVTPEIAFKKPPEILVVNILYYISTVDSKHLADVKFIEQFNLEQAFGNTEKQLSRIQICYEKLLTCSRSKINDLINHVGVISDVLAMFGQVKLAIKLKNLLPRIHNNEDIESDLNKYIQKIEQLLSIKNVSQDIDNELKQTFIEEAIGELSNILAHLPVLYEDLNNEESLAELRRSFHTLKGSGRIVGATEIGELSYAVESLLNKVIAKQIESKSSIYNLIDEICNILPDLTQALSKNISPDIDVQAYIQRANNLSATSPLTINTDKISEVIPIEPSMPEDIIDLDDDLMKIFLEEATEILERSDILLINWKKYDLNLDYIRELQRELHTLKGSARMVSLTIIGDLAHSLEDIYTAIIKNNIKPDENIIRLIEDCHDELAKVVDLIKQGRQISVNQDLEKKLSDYETELESAEAEIKITTTKSQVDPELISIFLEEAEEILTRASESLVRWKVNINDLSELPDLQRELHTLKGGANMTEFRAVADISHRLEDIYAKIRKKEIVVTENIIKLIEYTHDNLAVMVDCIREKKHLANSEELLSTLSQVIIEGRCNELPKLAGSTFDGTDAKAENINKNTKPSEILETNKIDDRISPTDTDTDIRNKQQEMIRVTPEYIESLVNLTSEASIIRSRIAEEIGDFINYLNEIDKSLDKLQFQMRTLEIESEKQISFRSEKLDSQEHADFDPLEMDRYTTVQQLARTMGESLNNLIHIEMNLFKRARSCSELVGQQATVQSELNRSLMKSRMVPFSSLLARIQRIVRQVSHEVNKSVDLVVHGEDKELDRYIANRLISPLDHMLRNAIDHGIESKQTRLSNNKPENGTITIDVKYEGGDIVLNVADDGAGINKATLYEKAVAQGIITQGAHIPAQKLLKLILRPGFSTSSNVTQISGRGVGMDIVATEVKNLGGSLELQSEFGLGTTFIIRLPMSLSLNYAIKISAGNELFAIPTLNINGMTRVQASEIKECYKQGEEPKFLFAGEEYHLIYLSRLLGFHDSPPKLVDNEFLPVLMLHISGKYVAVHVDDLLGTSDIVVKSLDGQLKKLTGISGATIYGDGRVALILDMPALIKRAEENGLFSTINEMIETSATESDSVIDEKKLTILCVDDSFTMRKVLVNLLTRHNFAVETANDGIHAKEVLEKFIPDLFVLDIEMPRLDGFGLAKFIRETPVLQTIPIIMLTSRTGDKHRQRAKELGVNVYLGKPYQESELLTAINNLLETVK